MSNLSSTVGYLLTVTGSQVNGTETKGHIHHMAWLRFLRIALMCVLVVLTLVGNSLVLACIRKINEMKSVTGMFLANLAISDLGVGMICLPIAIAASVDETLLTRRSICNMDGFSLVLFFITSIQTLCAIGVQKYIAVVYAMRVTITRKRALLIIASIWILSIVLASGPLLGWSRYVYILGRHQCSTPAPDDSLTLSHMLMLLSFGYIIPVFTMLFCYSRLYCTTRSHLRRLRVTAIADSVTMTESDLINTLVLVLLTFILCWLPFVVYISYGITKRPIPYYLPTIAFLFGYGNSTLNPIIYGIRHKSFRNAFREIICFAGNSHGRREDRTHITLCSRNSPNVQQKNRTTAKNTEKSMAMECLVGDKGHQLIPEEHV